MLDKKDMFDCIDTAIASPGDYCRGWNDAVDAMPKWISVEERLPGMKNVIAINANDEMLIGFVNPASYGTFYKCDSEADVIFNVTHWMPLPEPPKEEA
jgi:hypothetical protein